MSDTECALTSLRKAQGYAQPIVRVPSRLNTDSFWVNQRMCLRTMPLIMPQVNGAGS